MNLTIMIFVSVCSWKRQWYLRNSNQLSRFVSFIYTDLYYSKPNDCRPLFV